jgi:hypothetical protein
LQPCDVFLEKPSRGQQHFRFALGKTLLKGLGTECGKQRTEHAPILEGSQSSDVQFWNPSGQGKNSVALSESERIQEIGEAICRCLEIAIREVDHPVVFADPTDREMPAKRAISMPIDGLVSDVQTAVRVQLATNRFPSETRTG